MNVYQDLSTCHDRTVKNAIVNLPIRLMRNSKHILQCNNLCNVSLSMLGVQNKDIGTASQTLLTRVKLHVCPL